MSNDSLEGPVSFRLAWRWKESGVSGSTPWIERRDTVAAWMESFSRRSGERVDHWIEAIDPKAPSDARDSSNTGGTDRRARLDSR